MCRGTQAAEGGDVPVVMSRWGALQDLLPWLVRLCLKGTGVERLHEGRVCAVG
jgi:hypothetical protein